VGVNKFVAPYQKITGLLRVDPIAAKKQIAGLINIKKERDASAVTAALENLKKVAVSKENTMPAFIRCVEAYATVGEISDTLRGVFGVQREFLVF
jgi:methylmalonyl-CoA mutase N-terminal domain/subunit